MGFIYKITNIITNKCYIGETKEKMPETRWKQHKRTIEKGIGCPALQNSVKKYGIDNFTFKVLIICFDEERFKFEKEYIKKFNSIAPNGYNLTSGGEGGGFIGKKHSQETINKISNTLKNKYINNINLKEEISKNIKLIMSDENIKMKIKEGLKNSEKWKNAKKGNVNNRPHTQETINKLKSVTHDYFTKEENKIKHREIMSESKGIKVCQFDTNENIMNIFISLSEASRQTGISKSTIQNGIKNSNIPRCGFIWKRV